MLLPNNLFTLRTLLILDLLLVGYAGAGPYPQCFTFDREEEKIAAARAKEEQFLNQAKKYITLTKPLAFAPFAGTYTLGSRFSELTKYRGVPSVADATALLQKEFQEYSSGILLEKLDVYDAVSKVRTKNQEKYPLNREEYVKLISKNPLDYDNDDWDDSELCELIHSAYKRFKSKANEISFQSDTKLIVKSNKFAFQFSTESDVEEIEIDADLIEPFVQIEVDHNLLHRLLRGPRYAHWNNAEIGSHLKYLRKPNTFERALYHCMCFFHA